MRVPVAPLRGELTSVRPAGVDDVDLLVCWHRDPEVARYWNHEVYTHAELRARLEDADVDPYIVEADGAPVGYLQAWFDEVPDAAGLDMFLVPAARGRGLGPDAARALATHLLREGRYCRLTVDPDLANTAAIRAWEKAGFRPVDERPPDDDHPGAWLLMTIDAG